VNLRSTIEGFTVMRFPVNITNQKRCPVCKKLGPGTHPPDTPRPETVSLSISVSHRVRGGCAVEFVASDLWLGWDSGVSRRPRSLYSLGAVVRAARREGQDRDRGSGFSMEFCSISCLRQFLADAVDELERKVAAVAPEVRAARAKLDADT
jgi:hypothetical protein